MRTREDMLNMMQSAGELDLGLHMTNDELEKADSYYNWDKFQDYLDLMRCKYYGCDYDD